MQLAIGFLGRATFMFTFCYAPCLSCGALGMIVAWIAGSDLSTGFLVGFGIAIWPVGWWARRPARFEELLKYIAKQLEDGLISQEEAKKHRTYVLRIRTWLQVGMGAFPNFDEPAAKNSDQKSTSPSQLLPSPESSPTGIRPGTSQTSIPPSDSIQTPVDNKTEFATELTPSSKSRRRRTKEATPQEK